MRQAGALRHGDRPGRAGRNLARRDGRRQFARHAERYSPAHRIVARIFERTHVPVGSIRATINMGYMDIHYTDTSCCTDICALTSGQPQEVFSPQSRPDWFVSTIRRGERHDAILDPHRRLQTSSPAPRTEKSGDRRPGGGVLECRDSLRPSFLGPYRLRHPQSVLKAAARPASVPASTRMRNEGRRKAAPNPGAKPGSGKPRPCGQTSGRICGMYRFWIRPADADRETPPAARYWPQSGRRLSLLPVFRPSHAASNKRQPRAEAPTVRYPNRFDLFQIRSSRRCALPKIGTRTPSYGTVPGTL